MCVRCNENGRESESESENEGERFGCMWNIKADDIAFFYEIGEISKDKGDD